MYRAYFRGRLVPGDTSPVPPRHATSGAGEGGVTHLPVPPASRPLHPPRKYRKARCTGCSRIGPKIDWTTTCGLDTDLQSRILQRGGARLRFSNSRVACLKVLSSA